MFGLSGRVGLVTGGNGGIGLGFARGLAKAGAAVMVAGRNAAKNAAAVAELQAFGATADSVVATMVSIPWSPPRSPASADWTCW
jgi:2-deoxy-D-gluconate 3-dehydrogenase